MAITARNKAQLEFLAAALSSSTTSKIVTFTADISRHHDCRSLVTQVEEQLGGIDVLINLAGMQTFKPLSVISDNEIEQQLDVNLLAPIVLAREVSALMIKQNSGQIVNVGSTFGSIAFAKFQCLLGNKVWSEGISEALGAN